MKRKITVLLILSCFLVTGCSQESGSSVHQGSSSSFISSSSTSSSSIENKTYTDKYGVTYINETALNIANSIDDTRIYFHDVLNNDEFFALQIDSIGNVIENFDGTLDITCNDETISPSSYPYKKEVKTDTTDVLELNYDVEAAIKYQEKSDSTIEDIFDSIINGGGSSSKIDDTTQAYVVLESISDGYSIPSYSTHEVKSNSRNMMYYSNPEFYYDLSHVGDVDLSEYGSGKINNFNFNKHFGDKVLSYRDTIVDTLSYHSVHDWPQNVQDATIIDDIYVLYCYLVSDGETDDQAMDALININDFLKKYYGVDLGISKENSNEYKPFLSFVKMAAPQFMLFDEQEDQYTIKIDAKNFLTFAIGTLSGIQMHPDIFNIDEDTLSKITNVLDTLKKLNPDDYALEITLGVDSDNIINEINDYIEAYSEDISKVFSTYIEDRVQYTETYNGEYRIKSKNVINLKCDNTPMDIILYDDFSQY